MNSITFFVERHQKKRLDCPCQGTWIETIDKAMFLSQSAAEIEDLIDSAKNSTECIFFMPTEMFPNVKKHLKVNKIPVCSEYSFKELYAGVTIKIAQISESRINSEIAVIDEG